MDRLVWCVADGTHRVGFGSLLGAALKALGLASNVHCCLHACKIDWLTTHHARRQCFHPSLRQILMLFLCFNPNKCEVIKLLRID